MRPYVGGKDGRTVTRPDHGRSSYMKPVVYGRILLGLAAAFYGVIALVWHDAGTWQSLAEIWRLPFGRLVGDCLMAGQIAGGVGILFRPTARAGSLVLCVVYAAFSLACIPGVVAAPRVYDGYGSFFEKFSLLCGATASYALADVDARRGIALARLAQLGLGLSIVSFTVAQVVFLQFTAKLVPAWLPPNQMFWAILTTVAFGLAAIATLINVQARLALRLMTLMLVLFAGLVWIPIIVAHPQSHFSWSEFALTILIAGVAWVASDVAGVQFTSSPVLSGSP